MNRKYRWYHIYADSDCEFVVEADMNLDGQADIGNHILEMMLGMKIVNTVYPNIMRAIWAADV